MTLDKRVEEERVLMERVITERKVEVEAVVWEGEKHVAMKAREVAEVQVVVAGLEREREAMRGKYEEKERELEGKAEEKRREVARLQEEMKAEEERRKGTLEDARSKVGEYISLAHQLGGDRVREQQVLVRGVVDALLRAGVDLELVKKDIAQRGG